MGARQAIAAADWHRALLGLSTIPLVVERQAYRLAPDHSDEIVVLRHGSEVCVAARFGDFTRVWSCHDRAAADEMFEQRTNSDAGWTEAAPTAHGQAA